MESQAAAVIKYVAAAAVGIGAVYLLMPTVFWDIVERIFG
jgi:hypothetical protein